MAHKLFDYFLVTDNGTSVPLPNIADKIDEQTLAEIGNEVVEGYNTDLDSMSEWSRDVDRGLKLTQQAQGTKNTPWAGASNFKSPMIMIAALKFSDRAATELLRQKELVKTAVIGSDPENLKTESADRVAAFMNYQINHQMDEWREEHDRLIYDIPYTGTVFKKTFFDPVKGRNVSNLITYPNFAVNQDVTSIYRLRRFSEKFEFSNNEILERVAQGVWMDNEFDLYGTSDTEEQTDKDRITTFVEQQCYIDLDEDGYEEPYTVTVQLSSRRVARITPRFDLSDVLIKLPDDSIAPMITLAFNDATGLEYSIVRIKPKSTITKYGFLRDPQGGFLDIGYSHILGAYTEATNALTNQLIDKGTLSNRGGGWLAKGFRRKMGDSAFQIGEFKQTGLSAQDLHNGVKLLPITEPSQTLFALMQFIQGAGQELSASADLSKALGANAPATTTLAMIQEQQQATSSIINRIYRSMSEEFKKLFELNARFVDPAEYQTVLDDPEADFASDFNPATVDVIPTANPEISSKVQRIQTAQAEISQIPLIQAAGGDIRPVVKNYYEAIGSTHIDQIFPEIPPEQRLQQLLAENPQLVEMISAEEERQDLLAAAQADAIEAAKRREDLKFASELDRVQAEIEQKKSAAILNLERAETEETKNLLSKYTGSQQLDQNEQTFLQQQIVQQQAEDQQRAQQAQQQPQQQAGNQ